MNIPTNLPNVQPGQIPLESLAHNPHVSDSDKVAEVSRQFEAVLLRQILQDIRKPVLAPAQGHAATNAIYDDMITNQMAQNITQSGGVGLAKSLAAQLSHQVLAHATPTPKASLHD